MIIQPLLSEMFDLKVWLGCGLMAEGGSKLLLWEWLYPSLVCGKGSLESRYSPLKDPQHQHALGAELEMQNLRPCSRPAELESALHEGPHRTMSTVNFWETLV